MEKTLERTYNIPLRKGFQKAPKYKRAKKAVIVLKEFLARHMKSDFKDIKLGRKLNEELWKRGYKYPPHHVKITAIKDEKGIVKVELFGFKYEEPIIPEETKEKEEKKEGKKEVTEKSVEELDSEKIDEKTETKEDKQEAIKKIKKEKTSEKKETKTKKKTEIKEKREETNIKEKKETKKETEKKETKSKKKSE